MRTPFARLIVVCAEAPKEMTLASLAEHAGEPVERVMDALDALAILRIAGIDAREAYHATVVGEIGELPTLLEPLPTRADPELVNVTEPGREPRGRK